jgi:hypothetical protein
MIVPQRISTDRSAPRSLAAPLTPGKYREPPGGVFRMYCLGCGHLIDSSTLEAVPDHHCVKIEPEGEVDQRSPAVRAIDEHRRRVEWGNGPAVWGNL